MNFSYYLVSSFMASATYLLIKSTDHTPTRVSSTLSLIGFGGLYLIHQFTPIDFHSLASLIFGASFVGMCSHKKINIGEILFGSLVFAALFDFLDPVSYQVGGALGFSAFVSIVLVWSSSKVVSHLKTLILSR